MSSSRKGFFYLLLVVTMIVTGIVIQFLLAQNRSQEAVNVEQIRALQQVHGDTQAISDDLYQGESGASQQFQTHQKVMEQRLRQFNQQSGLLKTEAQRKVASNESIELNHTWFALSQLLTKLQAAAPELVAQIESKKQLIARSSEMLAKVDDLALALGRESRLKESVSSALSYVDLMAEVSTIRSSLGGLQALTQQVGDLSVEPSNLSQSIADKLDSVEKSIELLAKDSDRIVKSKLIELVEARDFFVSEKGRWSENTATLSEAFLTSNAIRQRSEDFSLQLNAKQRSGSDSQQTKLLRVLAYLLPMLGAIFLLIGGRRYIQSTSAHILIAESSVGVNIESVKQADELKSQLILMQDQKEQLEADLEAQGQKMQAVASDASQHLKDLEDFTSKLDTVEFNAESVKRDNGKLQVKLQDSEVEVEQYRLNEMERLNELQSLKLDLEQVNEKASSMADSMKSVEFKSEELERKNKQLTKELHEAEVLSDQYRSNDSDVLKKLEAAQSELIEFSEKSADLEMSLKTVESNASDLQSLNENLTQDLQDAQENVEKHQLDASTRSQELEALSVKFEELNVSSLDLTKSLELAESHVVELEDLNDKLTQDFQAADEKGRESQLNFSARDEELESLNVDYEQLNANLVETQTLLDTKVSDYEYLEKEKLQLDFELEARQQEFDQLLSHLQVVEGDLSQRLEFEGESTKAVAVRVNAILDIFSDHWHDISLLAAKIEATSLGADEFYLASVAREVNAVKNMEYVKELKGKSEHLVESLNKLSLGGKASADIVGETSAMATQGVGSMKVINDSLESTSFAIENMLPPLERLTENSQLMKSVIELLDSISEQAQSMDDRDNRTGLNITANDKDASNSKYDLFENFRMATNKMTELISDVLGDVEGLANSIQVGMNDVQDSSVHAIAMAKLMKQVGISQSQLNRLVRALLTQTDLQTDAVRDFSDQLEQISESHQMIIDDGGDEAAIQQLKELSDELKSAVRKMKSTE